MTISRASVLAGAAAGAFASIGILRYPGSAAQFVFKLANDQPAAHPLNIFATNAAKAILEETNGQLEIRVFPSSSLGNDTEMLAQTRSGAIEMVQIGNNILANVVPAAALEGIPFAFASYDEMIGAANGPLGAYIGAQAAKAGLRKFNGSWYGGTFHIENRLRPITTPADVQGLKIRVPAGPIDVAIFKAFGASPTVVSLGDVYTSLQTHLVDGIEVPLPTLDNFHFYEQVKFVSLTGHNVLNYLLFANASAWQRLPKNVQEIVDRQFTAAATSASATMLADEQSVQSKLTALGLVFNKPDIAPFRSVIKAAGLYGQWRDQYGAEAWSILTKTTGELA